MERGEIERRVRALDDGMAYVRHPGMRLTWVGGSQARGWLQDLVTADVGGLGPFETRRSLLLTPTGRIRADFHVLGFGDARQSFVLAQPNDQPGDLAELLAPYVLSSDVDLRAAPFEIVSVPRRATPPPGVPRAWRPSVLGDGFDLLGLPEAVLEDLRILQEQGLTEAGAEAVEARRIRSGTPRFPADLDEGSLPAEAGLDDEVVIDRSKGCYLGQESVAKVRNLGHPTRTVVSLRSSGPVQAGERVMVDGLDVGLVTSADAGPDGWTLMARVGWDARDAELATASGARLRPA
jgi:folate-binding protein YgfZ